MTPLDAAIVRRKLRRIRSNIGSIERAIGAATVDQYRADELLRRAIERLLQETIDSAIDINNHVLRNIDRPPAEDYYSSFIELGRSGVLDADLARSLAPAAGLRNRIVHEYEDLDDAVVLRAAKAAPEHLTEYVGAIERFLESHAS